MMILRTGYKQKAPNLFNCTHILSISKYWELYTDQSTQTYVHCRTEFHRWAIVPYPLAPLPPPPGCWHNYKKAEGLVQCHPSRYRQVAFSPKTFRPPPRANVSPSWPTALAIVSSQKLAKVGEKRKVGETQRCIPFTAVQSCIEICYPAADLHYNTLLALP